MAKTADEIHIPNVVTAVLASYRGYDTFGEAVVIFSAGLGVLLLLGLNGNAGKWRAQPNGIRISPEAAPAARPAPKVIEKPKPGAKKAPGRKRKPAAKKAAKKKIPVKSGDKS